MIGTQNVAEAFEKISEIHSHISKGEVFRGFRPFSTAVSGMTAIAAAALQPLVVASSDLRAFVAFWTAVATFNLLLHAAAIARRFVGDSGFSRRRTVKVLGQFLPPVAAGALITFGISAAWVEGIRILPGTWALLFSLALFSSRPYLPRRIGWVALFYFLSGAFLLHPVPESLASLGWGMGVTFGAGQLGAAAVLHRDEERHGE